MARTSGIAPVLRGLTLLLCAFGLALPSDAQVTKKKKKAEAAAARASSRQPASRAAGARKPAARPVSRKTRVTKTVPRARVIRPVVSALPKLAATTPFGVDALRADLGSLAGTSIRNGSWGMMVVSLTQGDTLFAINADVRHVPASTQKVLTAVLALNALGPQYRYRTDILHTGTLIDGRIDGDLILRGDGDPSLSSRFIGGKPDAAMDSLVGRLVKAGVREVTGRVTGDATAFEARSVPEGWHPRILQDSYAARVSGLSLNENLVWVTVRPTTRGQPAQVLLEPATSSIALRNSVRTVGGGGASLKLGRSAGGITVSGSIGSDVYQRSYSYIVEDPASFTTGAFHAALRRHGIRVAGGFIVAPTPASATGIVSWESPPLEALITVMNRESVNVIAEHLFRAAGRGADRHTMGSAFTADTALRALLQRTAGIRADALRSSDGSGLSQLDGVTPRAMVQMLGWADRAPWGSLLHASLPLAGESGTLRRRMQGTAAQTNLHAKTGTTNDVIALSGYVTARNGELLAFAMLYNGRDRWRAREAIDAIGVSLANWSR